MQLCDEIRAAAEDEKTMMYHDPSDWTFAVRVMNPYFPPRDQIYPCGGGVMVTIYFCPWTGELLPKDLIQEWEDEVLKILGVEAYMAEEHRDLVPSEFRSEQWWRRLRLVPAARDPTDPEIPRPSDSPYPYTIESVDPLPGFRRSKEAPPHLCETAAQEFSDVGVMIAYIPNVREYGFRIVELEKPIDYQSIWIRPFHYCPWCGTKLPTSLRTEWLERLAQLGFDASSEDIPPDFASDSWWRQQGY